MLVHWITLDLDSPRAHRFIDICNDAGIDQEPLLVTRGDVSNLIIVGDRVLSKAQFGCMSSHLRMLDLACAADDEWFFICEDDADWSRFPQDIQLPIEADIVKFHVHSMHMSRHLGPLRFIKDEPLDAIAYAIRPEAARRLASKYKLDGKWVMSGSVPVDVWHQRLARNGELSMYAAPLVIEIPGLDSSLTASKIVLRLRKAGDRAVAQTVADPTPHRTVYASRLVSQVSKEFGKEIFVCLAIAAGLGVWYCIVHDLNNYN